MDENRPKQTRRFPTQIVLTIRVIVSAYVLYLAYQIVTSNEEKSWLIYAFVVLFIVVGTGLMGFSLKALIMGEYDGGKADHYEEDNNEVIDTVSTELNKEQVIEEQVIEEQVIEEK